MMRDALNQRFRVLHQKSLNVRSVDYLLVAGRSPEPTTGMPVSADYLDLRSLHQQDRYR